MEQQNQTVTMMSEEEAPEVGPNDIVIHLVNPYKCGQCELEFLEKTVFKDHMFSHLESIKQDRPSSQIVMNITLPPETPGGVTVTRDILQLGEDGSIKQVLQPATNITLNQVSPLRELEEAGVIKLDPPKPLEPIIHSLKSLPPPVLATKAAGLPVLPATTAVGVQAATIVQQASQPADAIPPTVIQPAGIPTAGIPPAGIQPPGVPSDVEVSETEVQEIVDNKDGSFSVSFKGPNNEMQHIQILRPDGMKGDMMLEVTNIAAARRRAARGLHGVTSSITPGNKNNECDICGKVLSSSTNLIRHKMYHSTERPYVCEVCNKGFKDISNLKKHTQIHKRIYPCFLCKKSFLRKSLLAIHLKKHEARTTFVKTGNTSKEVSMRTFVDQDGSRVEEMSMVALQGQTFEYKHRIMKADGNDVSIKSENESFSGDTSLNDTTNAPPSADMSEMTLVTDEDGKVITSTPKQPMFTVTLGGLQRENSAPEKDKAFAEGVVGGVAVAGIGADGDGGVAEVKIPPLPEDFVKLYQCGHCGKRTVQRGNMMRHLIHHLKDKPFACDECPKQFVDKGELVKHKKTHTKPYRCHQCNGAFAHNQQLLKHLQSDCLGDAENLNYTVLEDGKTYRCDICHIEMKRLGNMIKHVSTHSLDSRRGMGRMKHLQIAKQEPIVSKSKSPNALYYFDAAEKAFFCSICCKMFKQRANAHRHVRVHIDDKPFHCRECDEQFSHKEALRRHMEMHSKPHGCDMCKLSFTHKTQLEAHRKKHFTPIKTEVKEDQNPNFGKLSHNRFYCKHCDTKLNDRYKMMSHIRKHVENKPFECQTCNKCFSDSYMLLKHKKTHGNPFLCKVCGLSFHKKSTLDRHKVEKHSVVSVDDELEEDDSIAEENGKEFLCSICKAPFSRAVIRMNHEKKCRDESKILMRLPSGKGFKCKICNKVATLKHNLMVHIRKHSDIVKVDSSGQITLLADFDGAVQDKEPIVIKKVRSRTPKQRSIVSQMRQEMMSSDGDIDSLEMESQDVSDTKMMQMEKDTEPEDVLYTKIPGGWACTICRRKFTDLGTILRHLQSHSVQLGSEHEVNGLDKDTAVPCATESPSTVVQPADAVEHPEEMDLSAVSQPITDDGAVGQQEEHHNQDQSSSDDLAATAKVAKVVLADVMTKPTEVEVSGSELTDTSVKTVVHVPAEQKTPARQTLTPAASTMEKTAHSIKKELPKSLKRKAAEMDIKTEAEHEVTPSRRTSRAQKIPSRFLE